MAAAALKLERARLGIFTPHIQSGSRREPEAERREGPVMRVAMGAGAAVSGIGPLVLAGAVRQGWTMWALQIFVAGAVLLLFVL